MGEMSFTQRLVYSRRDVSCISDYEDQLAAVDLPVLENTHVSICHSSIVQPVSVVTVPPGRYPHYHKAVPVLS
jgi:hypothetical protein